MMHGTSQHASPAGRRRIVVVSGGLSSPSTTRLLADRLAEAGRLELERRGIAVEVSFIELRGLAGAISDALIAPVPGRALQQALDSVASADGVIAVTPTFKASYAGLFKSFWDLVEDTTIRDVPVLLGATGGTARHSLMLDVAMRPLFSYLRAAVATAAVYAAADDWGEVSGASESTRDTPLHDRIGRAGAEFAGMMAHREPRAPSVDEDGVDVVVPFSRLLARGAGSRVG